MEEGEFAYLFYVKGAVVQKMSRTSDLDAHNCSAYYILREIESKMPRK